MAFCFSAQAWWLCLCSVFVILVGCSEKPMTFAEGVAAYKAGDYVKAHKAFDYNAKVGEPAAMYNLGVLYYQGKGVPKDASQAALWFKQAGEKGHADALASLGVLLYSGEGLPQNKVDAAKVFELAAQRGHIVSMNTLGEMYLKGDGVAQNLDTAKVWLKQAAEKGNAQAQQNLIAIENFEKEQAKVKPKGKDKSK